MAEYKALAQNTYKFVTEHTFQSVGDISTPTAPMFGKMKIIKNGELFYTALQPRKKTISADSNTAKITKTATNAGSVAYAVSIPLEELRGTPQFAWCEVDGMRFCGVKNAFFLALGDCHYSEQKASTVNISQTLMLPGGICKVIMYSAAHGTIVASDFSFENTETIGPVEYTAGSTYYPYAVLMADVSIAKAADDIILGIEIEYPKYDVTFSGTGLQYSIDDGLTFQDVTDGLALEQVEHIILKNTDTVTHSIGTTEGGTDVANIASGATYVAVPTADGNWYIS
jgi:hypothetical protein